MGDAVPAAEVELRARLSGGTSSDAAVYAMVARVLARRRISGDVIVDVGCGAGHLKRYVADRFACYVGADVVHYPGFPGDAEFRRVDLETGLAGFLDGCADAVVAVETIEHLENPRAFVRELTRVAKPGGHVIVTTPNQLSLLSVMSLVVRRRFVAFQDVHYPTHITALLEVDLRRMATECALVDVEIEFSSHGRIALTGRHYPTWLARRFPQACSDNILLVGRKPLGSGSR